MLFACIQCFIKHLNTYKPQDKNNMLKNGEKMCFFWGIIDKLSIHSVRLVNISAARVFYTTVIISRTTEKFLGIRIETNDIPI